MAKELNAKRLATLRLQVEVAQHRIKAVKARQEADNAAMMARFNEGLKQPHAVKDSVSKELTNLARASFKAVAPFELPADHLVWVNEEGVLIAFTPPEHEHTVNWLLRWEDIDLGVL